MPTNKDTKSAAGRPADAALRWKKRTPNLITTARLVLAAVFVWLLAGVQVRAAPQGADAIDRLELINDEAVPILIIATAIFIVAAISDALDGILARRWHAVSRFGRVMDPVADKLLIVGGFLVLAGPGFTVIFGEYNERIHLSAITPWMAWLILGRELLVTSIRGVYEAEGVDFSAGLPGKIKMVAQSIAIPAILLLVAFGSPTHDTWTRTAIIWIAWITVILTLWSGLPYIAKAVIVNRELPKRPATPGRIVRRIERVEVPAPHTTGRSRSKRKKKSR